MPERLSRWQSGLTLFGVWTVGLLLCGLCIRQGTLQATAKAMPEQVLKTDANFATALGWAAVKALEQRTTEGQENASRYAKKALLIDPLNTNALRVLGSQVAISGNRIGADRYFEAVRKRTKRDVISNLWALSRAIERDDPKLVMAVIDGLMRTKGGFLVIDEIAKVISKSMALNPAYTLALIDKLKTKPIWMPQFLAALARSMEDPAKSLSFFQKLKALGLLEDRATITSVISQFVAKRNYSQARVAMTFLGASVQSLQPLMSTLSFEKSETAFDWAFSEFGNGVLSGHEAATATKPPSLWIINSGDGGNLLVASKLLMLEAGTYKFTTVGNTSSPDSLRDFKWGVYCDESGATLATSDQPNQAGKVVFDFVVPTSGCDGLYIRLHTIARDRAERAEVSFLDPRITPLAMAKVTPQ